ncbi:transcriptional regulator XRE family [Clostridium sp. CAG:306]|nr:transcriptional regulator XRE family [Clostridium sp. CAG:306]
MMYNIRFENKDDVILLKVTMNIKKELGEKIKRLRKKQKLTQEQLAEMIDIAPRNLSSIEVGTSFAKAETLEKILIALNTTTEELFSNDHIKSNEALINEIHNCISSIQNNKVLLEKVYKVIKALIQE